mmetsp:Transcript_67792/g.107564  ORF Transcript_67792/g.107564 Transcript_67792/m.107564 type:complete len:816 (-) Transcript_67792:152-2599(-)
MSRLLSVSAAAVLLASVYGAKQSDISLPQAVPEDFDCPMRQLALEFAMEIQPFLASDKLQEIADALNGAQESVNSSCVSVPTDWPMKDTQPPSWHDLTVIDETPSIYVDFVHGHDDNTGSMHSPLQHLDTAVEFARSKYGADTYKRIILRAGRHYLRKSIELTPHDNNLLITNYNKELVQLSGATPLNCTWQSVTGNVYKCQTAADMADIAGLRVNGVRAIRARYPNGNPEVYPCGFCSTLKASSWVQPTCNPEPTMEYNPDEPLRNDTTDNYFQKYQLGVGGCCDAFVPNAGYWCGNATQGGGAFTYRIPVGLVANSTLLPNSPYANPTGAVVQSWRPGHWSSWMFLVDATKYDAESGTIMFAKGGFQGARGNNNGDEFYVENVMEELDYPTEYFFNASTHTLYYFNNGTGTPNGLQFEATNLKVLLNYTGSMAKPVENQVIRGVTLQDTELTYLDDHGMPSGGDWALQRTAAVYLDGVRNVTISSNVMTRLDGNAISVNRYARDVLIYRNEIVWNGDNAVSMWGDTQNISFPDGTTMGYDGTDGNQPRGTRFIQNFVHEIGIWEKQSSMWFQAKSCSNVLEGNIFFNGPRAGINFNDGFGGNSTLTKNLLFNTCRESGDHGPFNSWDRQVYVTAVRNGTPSVMKQYDHIFQNFMVANYNSQEAIDNDDGSCYYDTHDNFFVYAGNGMKNDFGGHDNMHYNNIYGYLGSHCFGIVGQVEGHQDAFFNNTCIINNSGQTEYGGFDCSPQSASNQWPKLGNNTVYMAQGGDTSKVGLCGLTEAKFQQTYPGADDGTVIMGTPDNAQIIAAAKALLF